MTAETTHDAPCNCYTFPPSARNKKKSLESTIDPVITILFKAILFQIAGAFLTRFLFRLSKSQGGQELEASLSQQLCMIIICKCAEEHKLYSTLSLSIYLLYNGVNDGQVHLIGDPLESASLVGWMMVIFTFTHGLSI